MHLPLPAPTRGSRPTCRPRRLGRTSAGRPQTAVELADHALRLTPRNDPDRGERILGLARYLRVAGEKQRLTDLLVPALPSLPPGEQRVRACLLLASGTVSGNNDIRRFLERALAESGNDAMSRAAVLAEMAANDAAVRVERIAEAEALALEALSARRAVAVGM